MKKALRYALPLAVILTVAAGCARVAPVVNFEAVPVTASSGKALQPAQVRTAIIAAGTSLGWRFADAGAAQLEGTLTLRTHTAVIDVPYSATSYSIRFKSGENLYAGDGKIHNNYNGWVQNLDRAIRTELARL